MKKGAIFQNKITALLMAALIAAAGLGACTPLKEISEVVDVVSQDLPTADNTLTSLVEVNDAMRLAMSRGETELTMNVADISESDLQRIGINLSTFWGMPVRYSINNMFQGLENIVPGRAVDVMNITNHFELSSNYYVISYIRDGTPIPEDKTHAAQIAALLPGIASEIFIYPDAGHYDKTLAAHDWLVANIEYDDTTESISEENGSFGAIVLGRTMCQGYAEALELLLKCYTDVEITQIVGEALNSGNYEPGTDLAEGGNVWGGHAWNAVRLDGDWYQIDATFNDPKGNQPGMISHFYFGQTDEVMSQNHRWAAEYFPVSDTENFLFFRRSGLFFDGWEAFQSGFTNMLTESQITNTEIAIQGAKIDETNIQFIYPVRQNIEEIRWREQTWRDISVFTIELVYS